MKCASMKNHPVRRVENAEGTLSERTLVWAGHSIPEILTRTTDSPLSLPDCIGLEPDTITPFLGPICARIHQRSSNVFLV